MSAPAFKAPEDRYTALIADSSNGFNTTVWSFYNKYFAHDKVLTDALAVISDARALTEDKEMMGEIRVRGGVGGAGGGGVVVM